MLATRLRPAPRLLLPHLFSDVVLRSDWACLHDRRHGHVPNDPGFRGRAQNHDPAARAIGRVSIAQPNRLLGPSLGRLERPDRREREPRRPHVLAHDDLTGEAPTPRAE